MVLSLLGSLSSPSIGRLSIGPLGLSAYGLMIALGVIAGTALASRRFERVGAGTGEQMQSLAMWSVLGGLIGARLYDVVTAWDTSADDLWRIPMVWEGRARAGREEADPSLPRWAHHRCVNDERKEDERCVLLLVANGHVDDGV